MYHLSQLAAEHLLFRLRVLNRTIVHAVDRQRARNRTLAMSKAKGLFLSDAHVAQLLAAVDAVAHAEAAPPPPRDRVAQDDASEHALRAAAAKGKTLLPFDALGRLGLTRQEQDAVAICASVEIDRAYERIYGYILDDLTRRMPSVALLVELSCESPLMRARALRVFGPYGNLRRRRLLVATGEAQIEARQELRLGAGVLEFLLTGDAAPGALFRDRAEVDLEAGDDLPQLDRTRIARVAELFRNGQADIAGVWGEDAGSVAAVVRLLCGLLEMPVRRLVTGDVRCRENCPREEVRKAFLAAATLRTMLWIEIDQLVGEAGEAALETVIEQLAVSGVPVILSGKTQWHPTEVLATRRYSEIDLSAADYPTRKEMWKRAAPQLGDEQRQDFAARFRLNALELCAAARVAGISAAIAGNGHPAPIEDHLAEACTTVTHRATLAFARSIRSTRRASDLVLPQTLHDQVMEIARFMRMGPRVAEDWGFSRLDPAAGSVKALFTGDSGTGKNRAADVIAGELSVPLIKVDLARVVSKWVGETERNLSAVFDEARSTHAVLFFDEADALFGRRGEVHRGIDRYANLEVSYLLQRLEEHDAGVVILASNLKDNIDAAFTRRFHVTLHFPRPTAELRRRLWQLAIPERAPTDGIDFDVLARIDLTGGGITGAARTAALLAADEGSDAIGMRHIVRGVTRQFKREARLVTPAEFGSYAALLQET